MQASRIKPLYKCVPSSDQWTRAYRCCCDALFLEKNLLKPLLPSLSVMDAVEEGSGDVSHAFRLKNLPGDLAGDFI